uniref:Serum deprivation-response protein-like n=1 Tax=Pundamilia nyererei TaxID=303518 RepID=A0A3B4G853_9CICH
MGSEAPNAQLFGFKMPTSPGAVAPGSPVDRGQVSAITVVALLDKLVNMMEAVQDNQQRMEQRQADLENAVQSVQGDVTRLTKNHLTTALNVDKLLERSRKTSGHLKEVRVRLDKQAVQVKKLENNHSHLLKRNHFKVLIFQEDNEIPTTVSVKDSLKTPQPNEVLQSVNLSSDDELPTHEEQDSLDCEGLGATSVFYERRSDRFKRSSLKKVDSLKKAFSRQSIEKKMNQFTTKIVPPEKREKIKKSFTPNHPKSPTAKSSSFKVSPMTFNVKKVRDGESPSQDVPKSIGGAHVEIPPLGSMDAKLNRAEVHTHEGVVEEMLSPSSPESLKAEFNGKASSEINGDHVAGLALPEQDDLGVDDEEDEEEEGKKRGTENSC